MKWKSKVAATLLALSCLIGAVRETAAQSGRSIKVAAVDFIPAWGDLHGNIHRLVEAVEEAARQGVDYAVFPETAVSGYLFNDPTQIAPYLDTIPGETTKALLPVLARTGMHMSVGIAERDAETGLAYNAAALLGPKGVIGKYRKNGLNPQDQKVFAPGTTGVDVFDTPIGRIGLLICYDDTYWQYARLAALRGAQIIGWHSVSDRVMPGTPPAQAKGDHSTIANVQYISAQNGVFVVGATRSGIETNLVTGEKLFYNGGSSLWSRDGRLLVQAPVTPPEELPPGLRGVYSATISPSEADETRTERLASRRPALYTPLLALHRSPVDGDATARRRPATLVAAQWPMGPSLMTATKPAKGALTVLPELSALPSGLSPDEIKSRAEQRGGAFETGLAALARGHKAYVVGSYPERNGERIHHTVALAGPEGLILGRYRETHPRAAHAAWATPGNEIAVVPTPLGRIGLATADELATPELGGLYAAMRTDILAAPAGAPADLKVEIDHRLFSVADPPTGRADFFPYAAAKQNQLWLVSGGRRKGEATAAAIYGPEPVVSTPTLTAAEGAPAVAHRTTIPAVGTWIDQSQLIDGQQAQWFIPLMLASENACLKRWRNGGACPGEGAPAAASKSP